MYNIISMYEKEREQSLVFMCVSTYTLGGGGMFPQEMVFFKTLRLLLGASGCTSTVMFLWFLSCFH